MHHRRKARVLAASLMGAIVFTVAPAAMAGGGMNCGFGDFPVIPGLSAEEKDSEVIRLFPTYAVVSPDGNSAQLPIRVWVFEKEHDDKLRKFAIKAGAKKLELTEGTPEHNVYQRRMQAFMVDNERGEDVLATVSGKGVKKKVFTQKLGPTSEDGHFDAVLRIPLKSAKKLDKLKVSLRGDDSESPPIAVDVPVIPAEGVTVISDIDDTFKVTGVLDKKEMMANTFTREFRAVPGMARLYEHWAKDGAAFHYVSASPWALQRELAEFAEKAGFPSAVYHLRPLRLKDVATTAEFVKSSKPHKIASITELFERFPKRKFILVGDSGEKDPEIYGEIAKKFPDRVQHIYIREVPGAENTKERFGAAFTGTPDAKWTTFADPASVKL